MLPFSPILAQVEFTSKQFYPIDQIVAIFNTALANTVYVSTKPYKFSIH